MRNQQQGLETPALTKEQILTRINYIKMQFQRRVAPQDQHSGIDGLNDTDKAA